MVLVNYGVHTDTVNGEMLSADWPAWMAKTLDKALDGVKCMFICGAQGDVGSTNVHPSGGDMNDTEISFDNEMKSPGMARLCGRCGNFHHQRLYQGAFQYAHGRAAASGKGI